MTSHINRLVVGTRFMVNRLGAIRCPDLAGKTGTVAELSNSNTGVAVLFDGTKKPTYLHIDYITPMEVTGRPKITRASTSRSPTAR